MVRTLGPGDHFGDISMLYKVMKSSTVVASQYCTCAMLTRRNYNLLAETYDDLDRNLEH